MDARRRSSARTEHGIPTSSLDVANWKVDEDASQSHGPASIPLICGVELTRISTRSPRPTVLQLYGLTSLSPVSSTVGS
jgi:hypothetical protein